MFLTIFAVLLGLPLLLIVMVFVAPKPVFAVADKLIANKLDADSYNRQSAYSGSGFAPQHKELSHAEIRVEGEIPADLSGVYLRNGTNTQFDKTESRVHMFNGAGMLHQVQILNGVATYSNSYVRTPRFCSNEEHGAELYPEFGDIAGGGKPGLFKLVLSALKQRFSVIPSHSDLESGSSTTAIQQHGNKLYCLQETSFPFALNTHLDDGRLMINGQGEWDTFGGELAAPFTAHPKIDVQSGDWYTYSTELKTGSIQFAVLSEGSLEQRCELVKMDPALSFLHDYYLTENFSVFPDSSLRFNSKEMMGDEKSAFVFDPDYKMRFGVIKRGHQAGDDIQWFTTDMPGHIWHTINGWEEQRADGGTDIVLYAPVYPSYPSTVPIHSPEEPHAYLHVYRLNLDTGEVVDQRQLLDHFYERPSFNTKYLGRKSRYAYLLDEEASGGIMGKGVLKYDLIDEKEKEYVDYGDYFGGEALFVSKPNAVDEDDGYLLDLLMTDDKACLLVLDAKTMQQLAKLHLPQRVPFGVHACWLGDSQIAALA
ncbi:MAG: carotenoid oxygenase family protein [Pseudomonadales bacterium]